MTANDDVEGRNLLAHVLLSVADGEDMLATATELESYQSGDVTAPHVVEKAGSALGKTPVEPFQEMTDESHTTSRTMSPDTDEHTAHARDIGGAMVEVDVEGSASTIEYRSRSRSRIMQFLSGDRSLKLVADAGWPTNPLPGVDSDR